MVTTRRQLPRTAKKKNIYEKPRNLKWKKHKFYKKSTFPQLKNKINNDIVSKLSDRTSRAICLDDQRFSFTKKLFQKNPSIDVDVCENNPEAIKKKKEFLLSNPIQGVTLYETDLNIFLKTSDKASLLYADFCGTFNDNIEFFIAIEKRKYDLFKRDAVLAITYSFRNNKNRFLQQIKSSLIEIIDDKKDVRIAKIRESTCQKNILSIFLEKDFLLVKEYVYTPMHCFILKTK